jgi:hypothetical protein
MTLMKACLRRVRTALTTMLVVMLVVPWPAFADTPAGIGVRAASGAEIRSPSFANACADRAAAAILGTSNCDTSPPVLSLPGNIVVEATGPSGATVSFAATASDANPIGPIVSCAPISGSAFRLGVTVVTCSGTGASGLTSNGSFTVQVQDTRPPTISRPPDITLEATGPLGAPVAYAGPTATDVAGPVNPTVACTPTSGSTFPPGTSVVTCSATDAAGNTASTSFTVTVTVAAAPPPSSTLPTERPGQEDELTDEAP